MSSQVPIRVPPRTTRASARAREESNKHAHVTSSYSQVYRKSATVPKPMSMSVDGLPTFLDDKNTTSTPCQTYESAEGDTSALPEKPQKTLVDRCYVLLTPLKKTPSSSGSTSESLLPPANRSTHSRTPQRQRGDAVPATNLNAGADRLEGSQPSKQAHKRGRGPSRSAPSSRRGSNHQSDVDDSPTEYREVQAIPHPPGMIRHLLDLVFDLATSALAIFGVYIVFVLLIQAYRSMNHSSCEVFCFVPA